MNPVEHYALNVGLLREGDSADFIVVDGWKRFRVLRTYIDGQPAADGRSRLRRLASKLVNKFKARPVKAEAFC